MIKRWKPSGTGFKQKPATTNQLACERQTYLLAHRAEATNQLTESMYREDTETDKFHWFELQLL